MQRLMSAYPLLVNDPYFSIWLSGERLNEDRIISWYGKERKMFGIIEVDGVKYCFMGNHPSFKHLKQTNIKVDLFKTIFTFENTNFTFNVEFFSPLLINDLKILTNPSCYVTYTFKALTNIKNVKVSIYLNEEITYEIKDTIRMDVIKVSDYEVAYFGKDKQNLFSHSADLINADWGYYYLTGMSCDFLKGNDLSLNNDDSIYISATNNHNLIEKEINGRFIVSFDDVASIFYYGDFLKNYYFSHYNKNIFDAISDFYYNYEEINQKCQRFAKELFEKSDHFEITTTGINHKHKYDANDKCYFCGEEKPISYAITVDGDNKDWPTNVLNNTIKTYGEEKTGFEVAAFLDDKFYYVYSKIVSKTDKVNLLEVLAKGNSADILFRLNDDVPAGALQYKWTQNLVDGFYITTFETVIDKSIVLNDDGTVKAAYNVNVEEKSKASFSDDNIAYWNIAKTNAWNVNDHLLVDANGIHHTHKYDENNTCMFCEEKKANETITVDGNSLDWNIDVLNTKLASTGNDNQSFEVVSVVKGDTVYFFVTLKCKSNTQNTLSVVFNCATEFKVVYNADGLASKTDNVKEAAAIVTFDEALNVYVANVEFAIAKNSITNADNQVKVGIDCWTSDADDKLGFETSGVNAMWWLINGHNSWDVNTNFVVTENGITK